MDATKIAKLKLAFSVKVNSVEMLGCKNTLTNALSQVHLALVTGTKAMKFANIPKRLKSSRIVGLSLRMDLPTSGPN